MRLKIGIVEDSQENINTLRYLLDRVDADLEIVAEARTLDEARELLKTNVDLAFLDIQLKEGNIFDVLNELYSAHVTLPEIVFATAHGSFEYATKAIQFAALDFLTKPLDQDDLSAVISKALKKRETPSFQNDQIGFLLELLQGNMQAPTSIGIILPKGVIEFVDLADIMYFEADESTCKVYSATSHPLHSTKHLGYYIDLLLGNQEFVQISKGCLVNTDHIRRYSHRDKTLQLKNGESLIASHRFSKNLRKHLLQTQGKSSILRKLFS